MPGGERTGDGGVGGEERRAEEDVSGVGWGGVLSVKRIGGGGPGCGVRGAGRGVSSLR